MIRTYISADIETNGMVAGLHSMISLGCSAHNQQGEQISEFEINILPYKDLKEDPKTMKWWKRFPEQYKQATLNPINPETAAIQFTNWVTQLSGQEKVLICHNAPFDFSFIRYWLVKELGFSPFFTSLDTRQLAWATGKYESFNYIKKETIAKNLGVVNNNGHNALADAVEQAEIFFKLAQELKLQL